MNYAIIPADAGLSDGRWQEYYQLALDLERVYKENCRSASWQDLKQRMLSHQAEMPDHHSGIILEDDNIIGWIDFTARNVGTPDQVAFPRFNILPASIPDELVRLITTWILDHLRRYDAEIMFHVAWDERSVAIAENWGGRQFSRSEKFVLHRDRANRDQMEQYLGEASRTNDDLEMKFFVNLPDELFDDYIALLSEAMADIPEEEDSGMPKRVDVESVRRHNQWRRANDIDLHQAILFDHDNRMAGLTEVTVGARAPKLADQMMTAVARQYRGRGLAKWLKAAMFLELEKTRPKIEQTITWMRAINEPIQHINAWMGFELERLAREFRVPREGLETYLKQ
ncbi:MAG: hypothetical protein ABIE70_05140 [bacterium]